MRRTAHDDCAAVACALNDEPVMRPRLISMLAATSALGSCGNPSGSINCTASIDPAVIVEIRDACTGAAIAAEACGAVRDGTYLDSLTPYEGSGASPGGLISRRAADERVGTYAVEVQHVGYRLWTATGVRVTRDECHVRTQRLRAALEPGV